MSWKGFIDWVKKQEDSLVVSLEQGMPDVAVEIADRVLLSLARAEKTALRHNAQSRWPVLVKTFTQIRNQARKMESLLEGSPAGISGETDQDELSPQEARIRGEGFFNLGLFDEALSDLLHAYGNGIHHIEVIQQIIKSFHQLGRLEDEASFLKEALAVHNLRSHEQAKLLFTLGSLYLGLGKPVLARQSLWQVSQLDPEYPGLEQKMAQVRQVKSAYSSRYGFLVEECALAPDVISQAKTRAREQRRHPDEVLIKDFGVNREDIGASLSAYYNVPYTAFDATATPPFELFEKFHIKPEFLKQKCWVPLSIQGRNVEILMNDPHDMALQDEIRFVLGTNQLDIKVGLPSDVEAFVDDIFQKIHSSDELATLAQSFEVQSDENDEQPEASDVSEYDSEVVRLVNGLLMEAYRRGASDIHIEPDPRNRYLLIRLRSDGTCYEFQRIRLSLAKPIISRVKILAHLDIAERRLPQDGKIKIKLPDKNKFVEFRVSTYPIMEGYEDVVLRVLSSGIPVPLERLGMSENDLRQFKSLLYRQHGMILVCGPTGSGKTTTLHSALSYINTAERKILTIEDPVEISQEGLRQVQVLPKIGLTFPAALRAFLRSDPDVIMVGEMRDKETARIGVEASLTGHLVFSTLHTNSAPETVTRLLDMEIDPFNFADSLICVLAQRLVKTLCSQCKEPYVPSKGEFEDIQNEFGPEFKDKVKVSYNPELTLYRPKGCPNCQKGYRGRIGAFELMINNRDIRELIKFRKTTEILRDIAKEAGMNSLKQDGIMKVLSGITDMSQVRGLSV